MYIDKSGDIVHEPIIEPSNYHRTIYRKLVNVKSSTYADFNVENSDKDLKFKSYDYVRKSKYKKIFGKIYTPNWSSEKYCFVCEEIEKK